MKSSESKRIVRTATMKLTESPSKVFPLLCPTREYDWIEGWRCDLIHSRSGFAEDGCIFRTQFPGDPLPEIWVVSRYEPEKAIEFVRVMPGVKVSQLGIRLSDNGDNTTSALWCQTVTSLSDAGDQWLETFSRESYEQRISLLETMLNHYFSTGELLTGTYAAHFYGRKEG